ncbi:unnamed protein product [Mytilus coruscus]|uniref:Uncharacterized protein n=1 Tax=Mytilus coruscus TaxID=42192 RepID=A0A6J8D3K5_MYTCO|nr:unnamed protein product [Mytilus coruscus]
MVYQGNDSQQGTQQNPLNSQVETVGQVTAPVKIDKLIIGNTSEIKDTMTMNYMYVDDEFGIFNQDLSLNLLFKESEEVQNSAPCEVSGSAKPSNEIEENISIDRIRAATITVPLVNNEVKVEPVIGPRVGVTLVRKNCQYNTSQCRDSHCWRGRKW